jgi:hypothetical protein
MDVLISNQKSRNARGDLPSYLRDFTSSYKFAGDDCTDATTRSKQDQQNQGAML